MGGFWSKFVGLFYNPKKTIKIFVGGLDASGKTTILYQSKLGKVIQCIPTVGFNVQQIKINKNITIVAWDVGGGFAIRKLFHHYYDQVQAVIWVIDSSNTKRIKQLKQQFDSLINDQKLKDSIVLIMANKQDLVKQEDKNIQYFKNELKLQNLTKLKREWTIIKTNALTGQGIKQGLDWLGQRLEQKMKINNQIKK